MVRLWVALGCSLALAACGDRPAPEEAPESEAPAVEPVTDVVTEAVWSPDGARLVATWDRGDGPRLVGLLGPTRDGAPPEPAPGLPLTRGPGGRASWSPDGLWVTYASRGDIVRARPDGTGPETLTSGPEEDGQPDYSPDGGRIVFVSDRGGQGDHLWVMDAEGGEPYPMASGAPGTAQRAPAWSPSGRVVAFTIDEDGVDVVYVGAVDGSGFGRIGEGSEPDWSPDAARIYFEQNDSLFWRPAGGGTRRFVIADARAPRASPDGRWLSFVRGSPPVVALWLLDLETGTETRITP